MPGRPDSLAAIRAAHALLASLSDDTLRRLSIFAKLLEKWQRAVNLVSRSALDELWVRHIADSLQVADAVPQARRWLDLGSGAGFPGLVTAIKLAGDPDARVHLIDSDQRKCAFLRTAAQETSAPAIIHCGRIETIIPKWTEPVDAVSARALAPLPILLSYAGPLIGRGAIGVFSKGKQAEAELTATNLAGKYVITTKKSETCSTGCLVLVERRQN